MCSWTKSGRFDQAAKAYALDDPWVVARNESGDRYSTKPLEIRGFRRFWTPLGGDPSSQYRPILSAKRALRRHLAGGR
jgi:hypothetical protein